MEGENDNNNHWSSEDNENQLGSLFSKCIKEAEIHFNEIPQEHWKKLPGELVYHTEMALISQLQQIVEHMMEERKMGSRVLDDHNVHQIFVPSLFTLDLESFWLSDEPFKHFDCPQLIHLNLNGCMQIGDQSIKEIAKCTRLKTLLVQGCHGITDQGLSYIAQGCKELEVIQITATKMTDDGILTLTQGCPLIRSVSITRTQQLSPKFITHIANNWKLLNTLHIDLWGITDEQLLNTSSEFTSPPFQQLRRLKLSECAKIVKPQLHLIFGTCLERLTLDKCAILRDISFISNMTSLKIAEIIRAEKISDVSPLAPIAHSFNKLKILGCKRVTNESVKLVASKFTTAMKKLTIAECKYVAGNALIPIIAGLQIEKLNIAWTAVTNPERLFSNDYETLHTIVLEGIALGDRSLAELVSKCPNIRIIHFKECHLITDKSMETLEKLKYLEEVDFTKCLKLSNIQLASASLNRIYLCWTNVTKCVLDCPQLTTLDLSGCASFQEQPSIPETLRNSGTKLKNFWARANDGITDFTLNLLALHCRSLQILNLCGNRHISLEMVEHVATACKTVRRIYLNGCPLEGVEELQNKFPRIAITQRSKSQDK